MHIPHNLLEQSLLSLENLPNIGTKITNHRISYIHRTPSLVNLLRWLEYENKLDQQFKKKYSHINHFLNTLYQYVLMKYDDERVFTMYVNWLVEAQWFINNTKSTVSQFESTISFSQKSNFNPVSHLQSFCYSHSNKYKSTYKKQFLSEIFYKLSFSPMARKCMLECIRILDNKIELYQKESKSVSYKKKKKKMLSFFLEYEKVYVRESNLLNIIENEMNNLTI